MANEVLHKIKAWLFPNVLTDNPNDFTARVSSEKSLDVSQISQSAITRGGAPTTQVAMEQNVNLFLKEMAYLLSDGYSVNTGYFTASAQIQGVFDSEMEKFNADKHSLLFQFTQGYELRKSLAAIEVDILGVSSSSLFVVQVTDVKTGSVNDTLTPGRNLRISGYKVKVVGSGPNVGVFFLNLGVGELIAVDPTDLVINKPSELLVVIPPTLAAGQYKLQVGTQFSGNSASPLKEVRTTIFEKVLTV
jgi:hypothetical protein